MVTTLVDLRAAFDSVDKEILKRRLEEVGISRRLRKKMIKIYEETRYIKRVEQEYGKRFWAET